MPGRIVRDTITPSLNTMGKNIKNLPKDAHKFWVSITPVKTGNARRNTNLSGTKIRADYQYAVPLDKGRSKQAPRGMSKPTEEYIQRRLNAIVRK